MVVKDIKAVYTGCEVCGSSSSISFYQPRTVVDLKALERAVYKKCTRCGNKLGIQKIEVKIVKMG